MITFWHPLVGVTPIYACGAAATQGSRIQANSAKFFENMSRPSGQLTAPGEISEIHGRAAEARVREPLRR
jgi:phage portal protein BeeE